MDSFDFFDARFLRNLDHIDSLPFVDEEFATPFISLRSTVGLVQKKGKKRSFRISSLQYDMNWVEKYFSMISRIESIESIERSLQIEGLTVMS